MILQKAGFGAKFSEIEMPVATPHHFRLLSDELTGYAWPNGFAADKNQSFAFIVSNLFSLNFGVTVGAEFIKGLGWHDEHGQEP